MTTMQCPLRDECWRRSLARDGSGAVVRAVPLTVTRSQRCGYESSGLVANCARRRRIAAALPAAEVVASIPE